MPNNPLIRLIHLLEIPHIRQEYLHLNHLLKPRPRLLKHSLECIETSSRFFSHGARDEFTGGKRGELAGAVDCVRGADCLGVWTDGRHCIFGEDGSHFRHPPPSSREITSIIQMRVFA